MRGITANMVVKNEDIWIWFALNSILPYVDQVLVTDTGSSDQTVKIIQSIRSPKIVFTETPANSASQVTDIRQAQLEQTKTPWAWIVDGDEIYPNSTAKECIDATRVDKYEGILVRRYDLLGDIYHRQIETVGEYNLFGQKGHLLVRLINKDKIPGLKYQGDYPNEGFFDQEGRSILDHQKDKWYTTTNYLYHTMYLKRSSLGTALPMFNRNKYKIEKGIMVEDQVPEVFYENYPDDLPNPLAKRGVLYEALASVVSPIKKLKRKLVV